MQIRYPDDMSTGSVPFISPILSRPLLTSITTGVVKTYRLTYEAVEVQHALFDKSTTQNQWTIESRFLREIIDHFGPTSEQLDIHAENNRVIFTSFTQKVTNGKGERRG